MIVLFVGVDGSGPSRAALAWALTRADDLHLPLTIAHVVAEHDDRAPDQQVSADASFAWELAEHSRAAHPTLQIGVRLLRGMPALELAVLPRATDLLVVGTHKTGYLRGRTLRSLGMMVAAGASCSVAVIPDIGPMWGQGVVVAVAAAGWELAVAVGAREAHRLHEDLVLVHARRQLGGTDEDALAARFVEANHLMADAVDAALAVGANLTVTPQLSSQPVVGAILDRSRGAGLLVLGTSSSPAAAAFGGSTAHDVLANINAPVLIARGGATLT